MVLAAAVAAARKPHFMIQAGSRSRGALRGGRGRRPHGGGGGHHFPFSRLRAPPTRDHPPPYAHPRPRKGRGGPLRGILKIMGGNKSFDLKGAGYHTSRSMGEIGDFYTCSLYTVVRNSCYSLQLPAASRSARAGASPSARRRPHPRASATPSAAPSATPLAT